MDVVEVAYKVHDSTGDRRICWKDGMPILAKPPGYFVTGAEFVEWVRSGDPPEGVLNLPRKVRDEHTRFVGMVRYAISKPMIEDAARIIQGQRTKRIRAREAADLLKTHSDLYEKISALGYDTNWGFEDRRVHGVMISNAAPDQLEDILSEVEDRDQHPMAPRKIIARRAFKIPYEELFSSESVEVIQAPDHRLVLPRGKVEPVDLANAVREA